MEKPSLREIPAGSQSGSFPCPGPCGMTELPTGCVIRVKTVHRLPWAEIESHLSLKVDSKRPGRVGFDRGDSQFQVSHFTQADADELNTVTCRFPQLLFFSKCVNTSFGPCGSARMPQWHGLCLRERRILHWTDMNIRPWMLFYVFATNTVAAWISLWLGLCLNRQYFLQIKPVVFDRELLAFHMSSYP